ncbi:hypothetical protein [Kaistella jeonii]|uniref:Uncharacterized protein n=1 Tax=Kaistella jeonii TaxID=266749 RepID=A0A0C1FB11_9FLAO|nr:hypothetical protein [Kaistella jeonii]KIA89088.1 hypothetical protein OA86_08465 [Kaistella jeonii]SFB94581.1 hypothetical protein SAMN05421876_10465 [Kaistella jeonii]VEI97102.1 Uncharacterised protein [Kaistella jeonii]
MKYSFYIFFTLLLSFKIQAQNEKSVAKNNEITIPIGTELKLNVKENNGKFSNFKIISESKITNPIDMMSTLEKIEKKEIVSDDIDFKFSQADFMGSKLVILTTVQNFTKPIIFKAKIRIKGNNEYVETSIVQKAPHVFSVEQWQDPIDSIILSDFKFTD